MSRVTLFFISFLTIAFLFQNCTEISESNTYTYSVDTIQISIDSTDAYYLDICDAKDSILVIYRDFYHKINIYNLGNKKELIKSMQLELNGADGTGVIQSLHFHNWDSIFIHSESYLILLDSSAKVKKRINLERKKLENDKFGSLLTSRYFSLRYNSLTKSVYFYQFFSGDISKSMDLPIVVGLHLEKDSLYTLPIYYSEDFKKNEGKFGNLMNAHLYMEGNLLAFGEVATANLGVYDLSNNKQQRAKPSSEYYGDAASKFTGIDDPNTHVLKNTMFLHVIPDPYKKCFYRLSWLALASDKVKKGASNTDKTMLLEVFDEKLELKASFDLGKDTYVPYSYFVNEKGLYLGASHPSNPQLNEDLMILHRFSFSNR